MKTALLQKSGNLRAEQVDEPAEAELVHVVDGGQVVAGEVQLHRELGEILKCQASPG
jgi:hypothetical protein